MTTKVKKPRKTREKPPRKFAVCDSETDPFLFGRVPQPFIWGFYDGETYEQFTDTAKFVEYIHDKDMILYAHNGGKFDWHFLLDYLTPGQEIMFINGRIAQAKIGECELRDSFNILPMPLAAYQKDEISYAIFEAGEREKPENWKKITDYLYTDCLYLYQLVSAFIDRHGLRLTQAGAAMKRFENVYGIKAPESSAEFFDEMRPYYYGGRVQCFEKGVCDTDFKVYDINSAYPRAMLDEHPFGVTLMQVDALPSDAFVCPQLFFHVRAVARGCFPWREAVGKKLIYPDDDVVRDYFITGWEMRAALKHNAVDVVETVSVYDTGETINFSDYILPLYQARLSAKEIGDKVTDILSKLDMNSLYGKWGADPSAYSRSRLFDVSDIDSLMLEGVQRGNSIFYYGGTLGDSLLVGSRDLEEREKRYYNVATAASITGWVRAFLFESLQSCDGPIYCDTDSIACRDGSGLDVGKELGQWKHEGDFTRYAVAGRKMYAFTNVPALNAANAMTDPDKRAKALSDAVKTASKGSRLSAVEIEKVAAGGTVNYTFDAPNFSVRFGARFLERKIRRTE